MTDIVTPPTIAPLPPPPQPSDTPAEFDAKAFASLAAQVAMTQQTNASAAATYQNTTAAQERATAANASATTATQQADAAMGYRNQAGQHAGNAADAAAAASSSAVAAAGSATAASKLNLGDKATPPTVDNQGQPLRAGATYYDTTLNKWRVWSGTAWAEGISAVAGVASVNGKTGAVTLDANDVGAVSADDVKVQGIGNADLNTIKTSGFYRFDEAPPNAPFGWQWSGLLVVRSGDTVSQTVVHYLTGAMACRGGSDSGGWTPWRRVALQAEPPVQVTGGVIDLTLGSTFYAVISGNTTFNITNLAPGHSFALEVYLTAGTMSFPLVTWTDGIAPTGLQVNKRHLFFFQLPQNQNAWLGSCLPNYAP